MIVAQGGDMRTIGLFLVIFLLLLFACVVPVAAQSAASSQRDFDFLKKPSPPIFFWESKPSQPVARRSPSIPIAELEPGSGPVCYTMRSYQVARDEKYSDSTHAVGYSTCQPSTRYSVKTLTEGEHEKNSGGEGGIRTPDTR